MELTILQSQVIQLIYLQINKEPKLVKDLDKVEEIYDKFDIKFQKSATKRFMSEDETLNSIKSGK